jgi:molecular chaperone DnaJ
MFGTHQRRAPSKPQGADLRYDLALSLDEAAKGGERMIQIARADHCQSCNGSGAKAGTQPVKCSECNGSGEKQQTRNEKSMRVVTLTSCSRCQGRGTFIESPCSDCHGAGLQSRSHSIKVQIPAGVDDGMLLRLAGQGEPGPAGAEPGDLLVRIWLQPHSTLRRDGDDLYATAAISFPDAALGIKTNVATLGSEKVLLTVPAGIQSGTLLRARGKGMPRLHAKGKGDLYVVIEVKTPTDLTARQKELLREFKFAANTKSTATGT